MHDENNLVRAFDDFFTEHTPEPDPMTKLTTDLVRAILQKPDIKTVDHLAKCAGMGKRQLQRLFNEYVGASPKWVIRRYRLHELIEAMNSADDLTGPELPSNWVTSIKHI